MSKLEKQCQTCGETYSTRNDRSVACSIRCLSEWRRQTYKGRKFTDEHVAKLNVAKLRENVRKEGEFPCDACGKVFTSNTSLRSHRSYCSATEEQKSVVCEVCGKICKRQRGLTWHMRSHTPGFFEEHSRKTSAGLETQKPRKRNSEAELSFKTKMIEIHGDNVVHKHRVDGINHEFDFYVPNENILVEFDGDYWHGNSTKHELMPKMKRQYRLDESYTRTAEMLGYIVRRVWASEALYYPHKLRTI